MDERDRLIDPFDAVHMIADRRMGVATQDDYERRFDALERYDDRNPRLGIRDGGTVRTERPTAINFTGAGVTVTQEGGVITVTIP